MKLNDVIKEFLIEAGHSNENQYARFLQLGISCLRELNMDFAGTPTIAVLDVQDTDTVNLPSDYINYMRIGAVDNCGNIVSLGLNPNISLQQKYNDCGVPIANTTSCGNGVAGSFSQASMNVLGSLGVNGWEQAADSWRNGELLGRMFGIGGGLNPNGYYRIDKKNNVIVLQGVRCEQIIIEYLSDLSLVNGNFIVDPFLVETVKCYIAWKSNSRNLRVGLGEKEQLRKEYFNEYHRSVIRYNSHSFDEWLQYFRMGVKMAPKM